MPTAQPSLLMPTAQPSLLMPTAQPSSLMQARPCHSSHALQASNLQYQGEGDCIALMQVHWLGTVLKAEDL